MKIARPPARQGPKNWKSRRGRTQAKRVQIRCRIGVSASRSPPKHSAILPVCSPCRSSFQALVPGAGALRPPGGLAHGRIREQGRPRVHRVTLQVADARLGRDLFIDQEPAGKLPAVAHQHGTSGLLSCRPSGSGWPAPRLAAKLSDRAVAPPPPHLTVNSQAVRNRGTPAGTGCSGA